jgi:hypothetical protein
LNIEILVENVPRGLNFDLSSAVLVDTLEVCSSDFERADLNRCKRCAYGYYDKRGKKNSKKPAKKRDALSVHNSADAN